MTAAPLSLASLRELRAVVEHAQGLAALARAGTVQLRGPELRALQQAAEASQQLLWIQQRWPLALARLWRPLCQRWLGLDADADPRPAGCGAEMVQISPGMYTCPTPGCAMFGQVEGRTSQRDGVALMMGPDVVAGLLGGANRAGKTEAVVQLAVATAGGLREWWVRSWLDLNELPEEAIQEGPGKVWLSALTFNASREYHREKLDRYLPVGSEKRNWYAENQAEATLPGGGEIVLKAEAQGRRKFQGAAVHLVILDEEHAEDIYEECLGRTADFKGRIILAMTPLMGVTWPHRVFLREPGAGYVTDTIIGLDNPHQDSRALRRRFQNLPAEKRDARLFGKWATAKGIIFPSFSRRLHLVDPFEIPGEWRRFRCFDFGIWFACLWTALDPNRDQLVAYRSLKTYDVKLSENARNVNNLSQGEKYQWTIADPAGKAERQELALSHKLASNPAPKSIEPGLDAVSERLAATNQGHPRLVITRDCMDLVEEIEGYKRDDKGEIVKANDHLTDDLRYTCYQLRRSSAMGAGVS